MFCTYCGQEMDNIGITPVPVWHCYRCEPMEKHVDILEWEDEDTMPGTPWPYSPWETD